MSLIIFLLSVGSGVGVFLYGKIVKTNIANKSAELEKDQQAFNPELLDDINRLSRRLSISGDLAGAHISVSSILSALEVSTLKSIKFSDFKYTASPDRIAISMRGEAKNFGSIALQSDKFSRNRFIENPVFSNLNLSQNGNVTFLFDASVNPELVLYKSSLTEQ